MIEFVEKRYYLDNIILRYIIDEKSKAVGFHLIPKEMEEDIAVRREKLETPEMKYFRGDPAPWKVGSLVKLRLAHHPITCADGITMCGGISEKQLKFVSQREEREENSISVKTVLEADEGYAIEHIVKKYNNEDGLEMYTIFKNNSDREFTIDLLSSFSFTNISPFHTDDAPNMIKLHRFRSAWSLEGKHIKEYLEDLQLERSWLGANIECEKFGVLGSQCVKRFFPTAAIEDTKYNVLWGAALDINSTWQMEILRDLDCISLSGGLGDREFGHWQKKVRAGEQFEAPKAYIACVKGDIYDLCHAITHQFHCYADQKPEVEQDLPIIFNEFCTTWAKPTHDRMISLAKRLEGTPVKYLVMDAGWSKFAKGGQIGNGDWIVNEERFPYGMKALNEEIIKCGLIPGIWFEFEVTTEGAIAYGSEFDHMKLYREGQIINVENQRKWWDFRKPEVIEYLSEKVIGFLKENNYGYIKVDYNRTIGFGCDGSDSPGEGVRQHLQAVLEFFQKIQKEIPGIVIENCASGGRRLSSLMVNNSSMSSFSDAHECSAIPIIAANIHHLILPRQSQIWATIRPCDTPQRLYYSIAATFLGRMCLSGDIDEVNEQQWETVKQAMLFYRKVYNIIKYGKSKTYKKIGKNMNSPEGAQVVIRKSENTDEMLVVYHTFKNAPENQFEIELDYGDWEIIDVLNKETPAAIIKNKMVLKPMKEFSGNVIYLARKS